MPLTKTAAAYRPEPGSLAQRVIDLVARNQEEEYTTRDLVTKFEIQSPSVSALLATPVSHGLLRFERTDPADATKSWRAGPLLKEWLEQCGRAPAAKASRPTGAAYNRLDPLNTPIRSGVPIPSIDVQRAAAAPYAVLWSRMKSGDSVELIDKQASSLLSYLKKNKHHHTVRRTGVGVKSIWRTA